MYAWKNYVFNFVVSKGHPSFQWDFLLYTCLLLDMISINFNFNVHFIMFMYMSAQQDIGEDTIILILLRLSMTSAFERQINNRCALRSNGIFFENWILVSSLCSSSTSTPLACLMNRKTNQKNSLIFYHTIRFTKKKAPIHRQTNKTRIN